MLRRVIPSTTVAVVSTQMRHIRYSEGKALSGRDNLAGRGAGQVSLHNETCSNPDGEDERRYPMLFPELAPKDPNAFPNTLAREYQWGHDSVTMFMYAGETTGPWAEAQNTTFSPLWNAIHEKASFQLWSGIQTVTGGIAVGNSRAPRLTGRAIGKKDKDSAALHKSYNEVDKKPPQLLMGPHTAEHQQHHRYKNPAIGENAKELTTTQSKRLLREVQYHLGNSINTVMVDGYFGSHPDTSTAYRFFTSSYAHAYFTSLGAIRQKNICDRQEMTLQRKVNYNAADELAWRRPGIILYHAPGFMFEKPRIVEEFGGPRPQDLGVEDGREKFIAADPYSIPMRGIVASEPKADTILKQLAFYAARWGFYADEKEYLTIAGDSIISADGKKLTVFVHNDDLSTAASDKLRTSPYLYGAHHHRFANGIVSRGWDVTSASTKGTKPQDHDFVEDDLNTIHRPLSTRVGPKSADNLSHRFKKSRNVYAFGFKKNHKYSQYAKDVKAAAAAGGHTFSSEASTAVAGVPRPSAIKADNVEFIIVTKKGGAKKKVDNTAAAKAVVEGIDGARWLYAEAEKLEAGFARDFSAVGGLYTIGVAEAEALASSLAASGAK